MKLDSFSAEIYALFGKCINLLREGSDILCKRCECVIGRVDGEDKLGIFVKLFNFRLVECQPIYDVAHAENTSQSKVLSRVLEMPNHLKRKADTTKDDVTPCKFFRPNENELCVMNMNLSSGDFLGLNLSDLDIFEEFNDIASIEGSLDLDLNDIMPFLSSPMDPYPFDAPNDIVSLGPLSPNNWPLVVIDDDTDSEIEFVPNSPPDMGDAYRPETPSQVLLHDVNLNGFRAITPPPPYLEWPPIHDAENAQINFSQEEVEMIYRALILLMDALGLYPNQIFNL